MSRRKQARPIRVLESEDGADMEITNGGSVATADDAESESGGSLSDSEDEDAKKTKQLKNPLPENESPSEQMFEFDGDGGDGDVSPTSPHQENNHEISLQNDDDEEDDHDEVVAERAAEDEDRTRMAMAAVELLKTNALQTSKPSTVVNDDNNNTNNTESCNGYDNATDSPRLPSSLDGSFQTPPPFDLATSHITLKALENTKVAVAQFAAKALVNGGDNPEALQEWAALQSNLMQLHQQYMLQMSMIQQLSQQLQVTNAMSTRSSSPGGFALDTDAGANGGGSSGAGQVPLPLVVTRPSSISPQILTPPKPSRSPTPVKQEPRMVSPPLPPISQALPSSKESSSPIPAASAAVAVTSTVTATAPPPPPPPPPPITSSIMPSCSVSSSFASTIITNLDPPPSPSEPNTLEMLQKRAQGILENASQGYANNLADELAFRKGGGSNGKGSLSPYDSKNGGRNEPFFKHRCRFCGKVFGSDSALQIHIRSHTGERPFKCNVCGSRFTTKGNLKVHFQRHISKFPDVKMNPNPVPEHLDKMHPPLLAQMTGGSQNIAGAPTVPPANITAAVSQPSFRATGFPSSLSHLYRPPVPGQELFRPTHESLIGMKPLITTYPFYGSATVPPPLEEQDQPENLCNKPSASSQRSYSPPVSENGDTVKRELMEDEEDIRGGMSESSEAVNDYQSAEAKSHHHDSESEGTEGDRCSPYGECSVDSKYSNEELQSPQEREENTQEQPENLSNKSRSEITVNELSLDSRKCFSHSSFPSPRVMSSPASSAASSDFDDGRYSNGASTPDPSKDPFLYTSFLPQPGSADNSWENLIEINKTSETSKLQELVDNIGHKLTDPNECVVCHRILSCKSALQMHYRTHTGERPFRCKICGRSFTTKGNLKTHMGVHRIKPPVRVHHQCPVCHKRFTNSLILQQHIRLHTGEPTDLTPEQIQASEINECQQHSLPPQQSSLLFCNKIHTPPPVTDECSGSELDNVKEDKSSKEGTPVAAVSFGTSLAALENHVKTVTTVSSTHMAMATMTQSFVNLCSKFSNGGLEQLPTIMTSLAVDRESESPRDRVESPTFSDQLSPVTSRPRSASPTLSAIDEEDRLSPANGLVNGTMSSSSSVPLDLTPKSSSSSPSTSVTAATATTAITSNAFAAAANSGPFSFSPAGPANVNSNSPLISSVLTAAAAATPFNPLGLAVASSVRGNTTCSICFKTFACNSALEIHYRSHTKERPFKCSVCDRGFSTKGNMKQHMLTHKMRDMPSNLFEKMSPGGSGSVSVPSSLVDETSNTSTESKEPPSSLPSTSTPTTTASGLRCVSLESLSASLHKSNPLSLTSVPTVPVPEPPSILPPQKRSPSHDTQLQVPPKRQASFPKHLCHVCSKNFSSSSALQIHMRTHTGDKPFKCNICFKAFTTKGNLKVHMGTHMWTNGASRRGRRMSLEIPALQLSSQDPQPDFFHRRTDFLYPYFPGTLFNGNVGQKLDENLRNGFFPFGTYNRHVNSDSHSVSVPWDLHFEKRAAVERDETPSPPRQQPQGESLAA